MSAFKDLTGKKFNYLTAVRVDSVRPNKGTFWVFRCDCGKELVLKGTIVTRATKPQKSCNECYQKRRLLHGMTNTKEFFAWRGILSRCNNDKDEAYENYGGRGINVCNRWSEFNNFFEDMGYAPSKKHSIDRIDNNKGYCKENCRWATAIQQHRNKRNTTYITFNGETKTLCDWAAQYKLTQQALFYRMKRGWPIERALTFPHQKRKTKNEYRFPSSYSL